MRNLLTKREGLSNRVDNLASFEEKVKRCGGVTLSTKVKKLVHLVIAIGGDGQKRKFKGQNKQRTEKVVKTKRDSKAQEIRTLSR